MNSIQGSSAAQTTPASSSGTGNSTKEMRDDFLKLMVAQLKNQDPLKPMDGTQFVEQLATLSQVEGIQNLGALQKKGNIQLDNMSVLQGAMLAGKQVTVGANNVKLESADNLKGFVEVQTPAPELLVVAKDASGEVVKKVNLGRHDGGRVDFELEGLEPGQYTIEAVSQNGESIDTHSVALTRVVEKVSPSSSDGSMSLTLNGIGAVSIYDVKEFLGEQQ